MAISHLQHEAVLLSKEHVDNISQAGRPFVVTDPNPPISYNDLYTAISTLSIYPSRIQTVQPIVILLLSYVVEWCNLLPYRYPFLKGLVPDITGDVRSLQPGLFSICTHLVGSDAEARKPVSEGGLGYEGVMTTEQGMALEILEWNRENQANGESDERKTKAKRTYTKSASFSDQLRRAVKAGAGG